MYGTCDLLLERVTDRAGSYAKQTDGRVQQKNNID